MKLSILALMISSAGLSCAATTLSTLITTTSLDIHPSPTHFATPNKCGPVCMRFAPDGTCIQTIDGCSDPTIISGVGAIPVTPPTENKRQESDKESTDPSYRKNCGPVCVFFAPDGTCIKTVDGCTIPPRVISTRTTKIKEQSEVEDGTGPHVSCIPAPHGCIPILSPPRKGVNGSVKPVGPGCNQVCVHFDANGNCDLVGNSCSSDAKRMGMSVMAIVAVGLALLY